MARVGSSLDNRIFIDEQERAPGALRGMPEALYYGRVASAERVLGIGSGGGTRSGFQREGFACEALEGLLAVTPDGLPPTYVWRAV